MTYRRGPEYQSNLRLGTHFAVIGGLAFTAACRAEIQASPTSEIFPTQSQSAEVIPRPTETLYVGVGMGQSEIIREVNGRTPPGAGGIISTENINTVALDDRIHRALLKVNLAPVHENRVISRVVNRPDGGKECYPIMPDVLFNPYLPEGVEERDAWLAANNTVVSYGDSLTREVRFKGLRTLSLRPTSKDVFCVSAVVNSDDNPFRDESGRPVNDGVVLNVLMDREGNIYGTLPGIYGANDTVEFNAVDNKVYVNGDEVWHVGDRMAELALTPPSTETAVPLATRFDDPVLLAEVTSHFKELTGYSLQEALEVFKDTQAYKEHSGQGFGGLDGDSGPRNFWGTAATFMNFGLGKLSIAHVSGTREGDFVQIIYGARPGWDTLMPFIVGLKWGGEWVTAPNDIYYYDDSGNAWGVGGLNSPEDLERWVEENIGEAFLVNTYLYFEKPGDWDGVHFDKERFPNALGSDASPQVKQLMSALDNGYIQRVTRDPEILDGRKEKLPWSGLIGRFMGLGAIYGALDSGVDPGLYLAVMGTRWSPPEKIDVLP